MIDHRVKRTAKLMPLHTKMLLLLLPLLLFPHIASSSNTTSLTHHRYPSSTNAGLTHRSLFSPSVAVHRSRYLGGRGTSPYPRPEPLGQQTRVDSRNDYKLAASSTSWSPYVSPRSHSKFYLATRPNPRQPISAALSNTQDPTSGSDRRPYRADRGSLADPLPGGDGSLIGGVSPDLASFEDSVSNGLDQSSKGASMSKLDAMLSRLESTNDEMLEELQHERDLVAARKRKVHDERINRHQNRRRRPHRRHDNTNNNANTSPFNLASSNDAGLRHHNPQQHHRRNTLHGHSQYRNAGPDHTALHRGHSGRGDEGATRGEVPRITADQGAPRSHHHRGHSDSNYHYYSSPRNQAASNLPSEDELQDIGAPGEEEATFVEEADYQDEEAAARGRGAGTHQHHLRERDAQSLRLASENVRYVMTNARCASPVRRCIDLSVNQTAIGKKYWPRCAIVSRCGEESGCCYSPDHVCTVAESHLTDLYFFYVTFEANSRAGVDRLTFENHTKCECRQRPPSIPAATLPNDQPSGNSRLSYNSRQQDNPSDARQAKSLKQPLGSDDVRGGHYKDGIENSFQAAPLRQQQLIASVEDTSLNEISRDGRVKQPPPTSEPERLYLSENDREKKQGDGSAVRSLASEGTSDSSVELKTTRSGAYETTTAAALITAESCRCPEVYSPSPSPSVPGACECVCDTSTGNCRRLMKGKRYFKSKDERCILSGECGLPACKFGPFLPNFKRCPRKREMKKGRNRN